MRLPLLPAGFAILCILAMASPAAAQETECGMLCQINGYLSTDHMTAPPGDGAASGGAAKAHRGPLAHRPSGRPPAGAAAAAKRAIVATSSATKAPVKERGALHPASSARPAVAPAATAILPKATRTKTAARAAPVPRGSEQPDAGAKPTHAAAKPAPLARTAVLRPSPATSLDPPRMARVAAAAPPRAAAPQSRTTSAAIPGSAPAMPAGFQPFATFH